MSTKPTKKEKSKAWTVFSLYIRTRGSVNGYNWCCTCGRKYPIKKLQAGHWIPGRHLSVLFDPRNCHPQCYWCNMQLKGNPIKYHHFMEKTYGKKVMDELEALDTQVTVMMGYQFLEIADKYKALLTALKADDSMNGHD